MTRPHHQHWLSVCLCLAFQACSDGPAGPDTSRPGTGGTSPLDTSGGGTNSAGGQVAVGGSGGGAGSDSDGTGAAPSDGISAGWLLYEVTEDAGLHPGVFAAELSDEARAPLALVDRATTTAVFAPSWSPNGRYVALVVREDDDSSEDLYVVDFSGGTPEPARKLASGVGTSTWSPDGERLAYVDLEGRNLWIADVGDTSGTPILAASLCPVEGIELACVVEDAPVVWAPEGRWLAFKATPRNTVGRSELFVVDSAGQGAPSLVSPVQHGVGPTGIDEIAWSPDSSKLAFSGNVEDRLKVDAYVVDWSEPTRGSRAKLHTTGRVQPGGELLWLPDGEGILVAGDFRDEGRDEIFLVPVSSGPDVGSVTDVSKLPGEAAILREFGRNWLSASRSHLAFIANTDELYLLDLKAGAPGQKGAPGQAAPTKVDLLLSPGEELRSIAWAPSAERLLVSSTTGGEVGLHWVDASQETTPVRLEHSLAHFSAPSFQWAPDSIHVAYVAERSSPDGVDLFVVALPPGGPPGAPQLVNEFGPHAVSGFGGMGGVPNGSAGVGNVKVHCCAPSALWSSDGALLAFEAEMEGNGVFELFVARFTAGTAEAPFRVHRELGAGGYVVDRRFRP